MSKLLALMLGIALTGLLAIILHRAYVYPLKMEIKLLQASSAAQANKIVKDCQ